MTPTTSSTPSDAPQLPQELLPHDGRFGCGPSKIRPEQIKAIDQGATTIMGTSHRKPGVKNIVASIQEGLTSLFQLPDGYEIVASLGGATAFWDAATFGLIERRSAHLKYGEFSGKFAAASERAPWLDAPIVLESDPGTAPSPSELNNVDADVVAWAHNETSTGAMVPVERPSGDALVLIDATSGAGGLPVDIRNADAYYFSPQKCFASDGGLWFAAMSPAALERIERISQSDRFIPAFLDLQTAVNNSRKNQTYNTPAVATLLMMDQQVQWMNSNGGLDGMVQRTSASSRVIYDWAEKRPETQPFVADPQGRSLVVTTVDFDDAIDAARIAAILRANGVLDTEPYRKLGRNQLRIGTFPAIDTADVEKLVSAIDYILDNELANKSA
ncbi:phosphoserine transaminase [Corynebacterium sp. MC-04]|uniref:Phosphoserine aminotransferase n=1 Tax=Corynebacterium parakroppenstedtii TaxID=2828363 RepID=A0ABS9HJI7_9CORY|nr:MULTISPECIES: phosphoserine transaminase [Corynebacterium]MDU3198241.1 phosphoserine transaminase [Corynebacterium kroppenstedtii]MBY0788877.1 phosphoserine transaminase [Corynebacterium parakroppenstedtii]MBY0792940.1 phosphoserine transaminase [Corynebacterium parakroppenstedtii]MBY0797728.1 phosphoserine transaminase [Corynebacterium parakroppenstedtii]MCF6769444.1 phosphoserine transaminase [Corynebacterium parakroppenstedtii]